MGCNVMAVGGGIVGAVPLARGRGAAGAAARGRRTGAPHPPRAGAVPPPNGAAPTAALHRSGPRGRAEAAGRWAERAAVPLTYWAGELLCAGPAHAAFGDGGFVGGGVGVGGGVSAGLGAQPVDWTDLAPVDVKFAELTVPLLAVLTFNVWSNRNPATFQVKALRAIAALGALVVYLQYVKIIGL